MEYKNLDNLIRLKNEHLIGNKITHNTVNPKISPLHSLHKSLKANFVVFGDYLWVDNYQNNLAEEYYQLNHNFAITDLPGVVMIRVEGEKLVEIFGPKFTNQRVLTPTPNKMMYGAFLDAAHKVFDDAIIFVISPNEFIVTLNANLSEFITIFSDEEKRLLNFIDLTDRYVKLQIQGPRSDQIVSQLFDNIPIKSFTFEMHDQCILAKSGFTLPGGYELFVPSYIGDDFWLKSLSLGTTPFGLTILEISRVEGVKLCNGHEFGPSEFTPQELCLPSSKANITSHSTLKYFMAKNHNLTSIPSIGTPIYDLSNHVHGYITSVVFSPLHNNFVGFCRLNHSAAGATSLYSMEMELKILELDEARNCMTGNLKAA